ncbi:MAG: hypothetical protein JXR44_01805 [Thiotrichales bacterium]|nr:hypothetical protein [Thiotrichales bacterium]
MLRLSFPSFLSVFHGRVLIALFMAGWGLSSAVQAKDTQHDFMPGDSVFVAFPAGNIKDDAFITGTVKQVEKNGDYLLEVQDYVEGHDYGSSCIPMIKKEDPQAMALGYGPGWEVWTDTTKLDRERLNYIVPKAQTMKLGIGKQYFVERNNLYIVFGRWKSDAPVMTLDRIERAQSEALSAGLKELVPVLDLVATHRQTFYDDNNRPLYAFERIAPAIVLLQQAQQVLQQDATLNRLWRAKQRNWSEIGKSTYTYFMIEALDKSVRDASDQLYEEGIERAGLQKVEQLRALSEVLQRNKH